MKKLILYMILIVWMIIIFCFSNQNSKESKGLSDKIIDNVITIIQKLNNTKIDTENRKTIYKYLTYPIRKLAHVTIYFILGIISCNIVLLYNNDIKKVLLICILVCFCYAMSDEIHQLFTFGRTGSVFDVLIDTCGSILGILLSYIIVNGKKCKNHV